MTALTTAKVFGLVSNNYKTLILCWAFCRFYTILPLKVLEVIRTELGLQRCKIVMTSRVAQAYLVTGGRRIRHLELCRTREVLHSVSPVRGEKKLHRTWKSIFLLHSPERGKSAWR
jgi:hypothetical protein